MDINKIILKILDDKASQEEYDQLKEWKGETEINIENMKEYSDLWKSADELKNYKSFDTNNAWNDLKPRLGNEYRWLGYALLITLMLLIGFIGFSLLENKKPEPVEFKAAEKVMQFALNDNTQIWLDRNATVSNIIIDNVKRHVTLQGQAYFDVARSKDQDFVVDLGSNGKVEVLGTEFSILNNVDDLEVNVTEGSVRYIKENNKIDLRAGDALKLLDDGSLVKYRQNNSNFLSWKTNVLTFVDTPLRDVLNTVCIAFSKDLSIDDDILESDCKLRSEFKEQDLKSILAELERIFNLKYSWENDKLHFHSAKC